MIPVDMTVLHDPPTKIGDCFRCCIASILELPANKVPHFCGLDPWTDQPDERWRNHLLAFLEPMGLYYFEIAFSAEILPEWSKHLELHHTISGISPRKVRHACVGFGGAVVHDPHPSRAGISPEDGSFLLGFVCKK